MKSQAPDLSGTWVADLARSRLPGPAPREMLVTIVHREPDVHVEMTITGAGPQRHHVVFAARTNGDETNNVVLGAPRRSRAQWIGSELLIESSVQQSGREMHFRDLWSLSSDGRTLTWSIARMISRARLRS